MSVRYTNYLSAGVRLSRSRTRDANPSVRTSSLDLSAPRSALASLYMRERSSDGRSRGAVRSTDFSINGIERFKNRSRDDGAENNKSLAREEFCLNKSKDHQIGRLDSDISHKTISAHSTDVPKKNKKYAWREEKSSYNVKDFDVDNVDQFSNKKPKYIEDYNKTVEDILEKVKLQEKLKENSWSSAPRKTSWKREDFDIEEEIRKLKDKNMLRKSTMLSDKTDDMDTRKVKVEVKPSFTERYLQKQIDRKIEAAPQQEVKKGAWRKDFARYEEDLELKKLRKETEKKINSLDSESGLPTEETKCRVKKITLQIIDSEPKSSKRLPVKPSNPPGHNTVTEKSPATFVTVRLNPNTQTNTVAEEKVDASLTIKKKTENRKVDSNDASHLKIKSQDVINATKVSDKVKEAKIDVIENGIKTDGKSKAPEENVKSVKSENEVRKDKTISQSVGEKRLTPGEALDDDTKNQEGSAEDEDEDTSGMRAMRKETNDTFASFEAEFEAGRSKLAAVRARIKRAREMAAASNDD